VFENLFVLCCSVLIIKSNMTFPQANRAAARRFLASSPVLRSLLPVVLNLYAQSFKFVL